MDLQTINLMALEKIGEGFQAEVFSVSTDIMSAYIDESRLSNVEDKSELGLAIRVIKDNKMGSASCTLNHEGDILECVRRAMKASQLSPTDDRIKGFVDPQKSLIRNLSNYDQRIHNLEASGLAEITLDLIDNCKAKIPRAMLRVAKVRTAICNNSGLNVVQKCTKVYGHFTSMIEVPNPGEGTESIHSTHLAIDSDYMAETLYHKAKRSAEASTFKGRKNLSVILPPSELGDMLLSSAGSALNGENVLNGRSRWANSVGEAIASDNLTILDDPTRPAPLCARFDDEGSPCYTKTLVENGILKMHLYDNYNGTSTGNGLRRSAIDFQDSFCSPVSIKPMNLTVVPGRISEAEIIKETKCGIIVEKFAWPEADPFTGRFALEVRCGLMVEAGSIIGTIKNALLTGNMFDSLFRVNFISDTLVNTGNSTIPTMSFEGMELIGN